jgi:hypothetical protein
VRLRLPGVKYFVCTVVGLGLIVAAIVATSYAVYQLLQVGTCTSGGPYQVARECPDGTELLGLAVAGGVTAMFAGLGLYSFRGRAPGSDRDPRPGVGLVLVWCGIFLGIAFASFWGVWGPDANPGPGGKLGGLIVGFLFVPMGIGGALMFWHLAPSMRGGLRTVGIGAGDLWKITRAAGSGDVEAVREASGASAWTRAGVGGTGGNFVSELERLATLRREGAISDAEFERLKKQALDRL